jgi:hypothetical protein
MKKEIVFLLHKKFLFRVIKKGSSIKNGHKIGRPLLILLRTEKWSKRDKKNSILWSKFEIAQLRNKLDNIYLIQKGIKIKFPENLEEISFKYLLIMW